MPQGAETSYDVVIVGGGAAGLSAAVALGRSRRSVVVIDAGEPRNAPAAGVHNLLTRDGMSPLELTRVGREEARSYGAVVRERTTAIGARRDDAGFVVDLADGSRVRGKRMLVTTGLIDALPEVPGLAERWGRDVIHCPYCHGWEVRDEAIGILGTGPAAMHQTLMFRQLSQDVTLFVHTAQPPDAEQAEQLAARGIRVVTGEVASVSVANDELDGVVMADGSRHPLRALVVAPSFRARGEILVQLGLEVTETPMGTVVESDAMGQTAVPGVWAAGNVTDLSAQVVSSAAAGLAAGASINADLIAADTRAAVEVYRASR
ncbi:NAD(P)/FAD-dependent oxidoreductase [Glaciihabitans sp. dw_435]|uniref:NAD(P)/FAD-dependent oxidoreductase n=1 Tax=Glaciihabitans sp. dw_435 TaxID=2720081 RepID=UPI001BD57D91|nr:NAD(P)/FAD-dependent oxidoreductase [Glaciihabitans sp. dw_435]